MWVVLTHAHDKDNHAIRTFSRGPVHGWQAYQESRSTVATRLTPRKPVKHIFIFTNQGVVSNELYDGTQVSINKNK